MAINSNSSNSWPFKNFATNLRGTQSSGLYGRTAMVVPRLKYTFIVDFQLNPLVLNASQTITNLQRFVREGRLFTPLKSIDHPSTNFEVVTLRNYNALKKIPIKSETQPGTMTFHDDSASIAMALWKEYMDFYHYTGDIGINMVGQSNLTSVSENNNYWLGGDMTGDEVRSDMAYRPSLGMKLRTNDTKYFFENIVIYDLGSEPDSVNIYYYYHPVISSFTHENYDVEDSSGKQAYTMTFEPEGFYSIIGQSRNKIVDLLYSILGEVPEGYTTPSDGHAVMTMPERKLGNVVSNTFDKIGNIGNQAGTIINWDDGTTNFYPDGSSAGPDSNGIIWDTPYSTTDTGSQITNSKSVIDNLTKNERDAYDKTVETFELPPFPGFSSSDNTSIPNERNIAQKNIFSEQIANLERDIDTYQSYGDDLYTKLTSQVETGVIGIDKYNEGLKTVDSYHNLAQDTLDTLKKLRGTE